MSRAAKHLLQRLMRDPRLAHLIGPGSQAFDLLTAEHADAVAEPVDLVREDIERQLAKRSWCGEMLDWHDAALTKPDADITVLCWHAGDGECWNGYWDGAGWIGCESGGSVLGVTHWAEPRGPR